MIEYENLRLSNQLFIDELKQAAAEVIDSGWYVLGKKVEQFEKEFASFIGASRCIGVANGLDALTLSLRSLNLHAGAEVLVPSNTYIATILSILHNGLIPVLVEPEIQSYNINPGLLEQHLTAKTRAVLVVHLYGKACKMDEISDFCNRKKLYLLEDCAQSHGATFKGKMTGTFGDLNSFSFYPTKNLGAIGDAGCVTTDNEELATSLLRLRNYGSSVKYHNEVVGFNSRLDEIQAAFLSVKLRKLNEITAHKQKLAEIYFKNLTGTQFVLPLRHEDYKDVFHIFNIRHPQRDRVRQYLLENGVKTEVHYPVAPADQNALKSIMAFQATKKFPIAAEIHATTISLPISFFHTQADVEVVCDLLKKYH